MQIRKAAESDLESVMDLYEEGRKYMRENGNQNQWTNGYPQRELVLEDIHSGKLYLCQEGTEVLAVFFFDQGADIEPTYRKIEGAWPNDLPYGVIHRITSASHMKGVASFCVNWCKEQCSQLRIDTHRDNHVMQRFVEKNGFVYCGVIWIEDGSERLAYQWSKVR